MGTSYPCSSGDELPLVPRRRRPHTEMGGSNAILRTSSMVDT